MDIFLRQWTSGIQLLLAEALDATSTYFGQNIAQTTTISTKVALEYGPYNITMSPMLVIR